MNAQFHFAPPVEVDLAQTYPQLAPHEEDAAAVTLLSAQSQHLIEDLTPALTRLLELVPGPGASTKFLDAVPQLRLKFYPHNPQRAWTPAELPRILHAFTRLVCHAQRLHAFPLLQMKFWLDVLQSRMAHTTTTGVQQHEFLRATFPAFVVDFCGLEQTPLVVDLVLEDALVAFMTAPASLPHTPPLSIGFAFRNCCPRATSLEVLERFLDRTFASPTRLFDLRMLDISEDNHMPLDLAVLARIVDKSVRQYGVEELVLDGIIPAYGSGISVGWAPPTPPTPTQASALAILRSVFAIDALPALASREAMSTSITPPSSSLIRLRRFSMSKNACLEYFAVRFSTLRYGCSLEEDVTTYVSPWTGSNPQYKNYWRWLAFGLFYPRPQRFARRFRLRNIGHIEHCPLSVKVFAATLRNPAAELIFDGKHKKDEGDNSISLPTTELLVCVIKAGARVDLFQTGNHAMPEWTDVLSPMCELEAIYERADGAVCVVVPGVGLGWVHAESIVRIEREPLSCDRSEQDGLFAADLSWGLQQRADTGKWWRRRQQTASAHAMVELLGHQFYLLGFGHNRSASGFLPVVLARGTNLTELVLERQKLLRADGDALLDALSGPLRNRLQVLNLKSVYGPTGAFVDRLFSILGDVDTLPALRELRLGRSLNPKQLEALYTVLEVNSTLALVQVVCGRDGRVSWETKKKALAIKHRLNAAFHGQRVIGSLPMASKLAFLSVLRRGGNALDAWVVTSIVAFAAERDVRRMITWDDESRLTPEASVAP